MDVCLLTTLSGPFHPMSMPYREVLPIAEMPDASSSSARDEFILVSMIMEIGKRWATYVSPGAEECRRLGITTSGCKY
jgi:hypothetical protein